MMESLPPLFTAAKHGDLGMALRLLDEGADPDYCLSWMEPDWIGYGRPTALTALDLALQNEHKKIAELLAQRSRNPWVEIDARVDPLWKAARLGFASVVDSLILRGASPGSLGDALGAALSEGHEAIARRLMRASVAPPIYALDNAARDGRIDVAALLLDEGLPPTGPWVMMAARLNRPDVMEKLLARGFSLTRQDGPAALEKAASLGHLGALRAILARGIDAMSSQAIRVAARAGHPDAVDALLEAGADRRSDVSKLVDAARDGHADRVKAWLAAGTDPCEPALMLAARGGHVEAVRCLLDARADPKAADPYGFTPLREAARKGHGEILLLLLNAGADPSAEDQSGSTALIEAARGGHAVAVRCLLDAGADVRGADMYGLTALTEAARGGHAEIARALLAAGADPSAQDEIGATALMWAARHGHVEVARLMLEAGADPRHRDVGGRTVLEYARAGESPATVALIEETIP